jgi:hypothetical protein
MIKQIKRIKRVAVLFRLYTHLFRDFAVLRKNLDPPVMEWTISGPGGVFVVDMTTPIWLSHVINIGYDNTYML